MKAIQAELGQAQIKLNGLWRVTQPKLLENYFSYEQYEQPFDEKCY